MGNKQKADRRGTAMPTILLSFLLVLLGLLLLSASGLIPNAGLWTYVQAFVKDLGIVILAVTTVHLLYHLVLAKSYQDEFVGMLRAEVARGESNAAVCAALGISKIYADRTVFEQEHSLASWLPCLTEGSHLRIVARSLFHLMSKAEILQSALQQGARLELCLLHPDTPSQEAAKISDMEVFDIHAAVSVFKKKIADTVSVDKPAGSVELRYHRLVLFDTYLYLASQTEQLVVWDLSFGRSISAKRIFLLDAGGPFAVDLTRRYTEIWNGATRVFEYKNCEVLVDGLPESAN